MEPMATRHAFSLLLALLLLQLPPPAVRANPSGLGAALLQAQHYHGKGRLAEAIRTLEQARQRGEGGEDFVTHLLLARWHHEALELEAQRALMRE